MAKIKSEIVEVIGDHKRFRDEINHKLDSVSNSEILDLSISTCETTKGTKYTAVILYRNDGSYW